MSQDEPVDGPTGQYRKETVKKLERENEVDTIDRDTSNESVAWLTIELTTFAYFGNCYYYL